MLPGSLPLTHWAQGWQVSCLPGVGGDLNLAPHISEVSSLSPEASSQPPPPASASEPSNPTGPRNPFTTELYNSFLASGELSLVCCRCCSPWVTTRSLRGRSLSCSLSAVARLPLSSWWTQVTWSNLLGTTVMDIMRQWTVLKKRMLLFNQAVSMTSSRQLEEGPACVPTHRATSVTQPTRSSPGPVSCSAVTVLHVWYSVMRHNVEGIKYHYKEYWGFIYVYYAKRREGRNRKVAL